MISIEELYKHVGVLTDAKDKASEHEDDYKAILTGLKSNANEKRLASQFIARFFKYFPHLAEQSLEAMFDLCEDTDVTIRKQAVKDLPTLCRTSVENCQRVADILTQLLQSTDTIEISLVHMSLVALLRINAKGTLAGIFSQILHGEETIRERAINFVSIKIKFLLAEDIIKKDVEESFVQQCRQVLEDVTGTEFITFMKILQSLPSMTSLQGRQQLLDIIVEQANLNEKFDPKDTDCVDCLIQCIKEAAHLFSKNVHSDRFVEHLCLNVLPVLNEIKGIDESDSTSTDVQLELLKLLADMVVNSGQLETNDTCVANVFSRLIEYMPLPKENESDSNDENPKLQFSYVECLMFTFHQLARRCPQFLTGEENSDRLKDFRIRLQYFARGLQGYIKSLRTALAGKTGDALKTEENRVRALALKTTNNINSLIKDLFYNPPAYKAVVTLSFKILVPQKSSSPQEASPGQKRPGITPVTFDLEDPAKKSKTEKGIYAPPGGKFSDKAGTFPAGSRGGWQGGRPQGGRGRGRGGRGYRRW